jgi:hypothetical protein
MFNRWAAFLKFSSSATVMKERSSDSVTISAP